MDGCYRRLFELVKSVRCSLVPRRTAAFVAASRAAGSSSTHAHEGSSSLLRSIPHNIFSMAQPHETVSMSQGTGHRGGPPSAIPDEERQKFADSSAPLFNMYRDMAKEEDNKMAERWQKDADGILIFTGLFSAAVAALAAVTVMDLKPNSQDTSAFYLENIYQLLADPNISRSSIPVTPLRPPPFSPPKYVIWVNSLWFLSLAISLTCAMLATLIHQWARRYLRMTHRLRDSPHDAARIRAFFAHGIDKFRFSWVVEAIPTLIHASLFLFFTGLLIYLFNTNHTVFHVVFWGVVVFLGAYLLITIIPIIWRDSPYYSPLSSLALLACFGITFPVMSLCACLAVALNRGWEFIDMYINLFSGILYGMEKVAERNAREPSPEMDGYILKWTFDTLTQDHDLDRFFNAIVGFNSSNRNVVENPRRSLARLRSSEFSSALKAFFDRTQTVIDSSISESDKMRRIITCVKVAETFHVMWYVPWNLVQRILRWDWHGQLSVELGHSLRNRDNRSEQEIGLLAQSIIALIIVDVQGSNDRWIALAADQLGTPEYAIRRYLDDGNDDVLLANLIHIHARSSPPLRSTVNIRLAWWHSGFHDHFTVLRSELLFLACSTTSVSCGMKLFQKHRTAGLTVLLP
ncbi:hypothetical protein BJV78DRAFT_208802 [Lactifluus subvellereus]|nr:hypothetical protein BJV78DRAFT_208802 [Lactifluus subvellereus]